MAFRKHTLRTMSPTARKVARLAGEIESSARRLKNLIPDLQELDLDSRALETAKSGLTLTDSDLWGLRDAITYCQTGGYFKDNQEWADSMLTRINKQREAQAQ